MRCCDLFFTFDKTSKTWFALGGISLETVPGVYAIELTGETVAGTVPDKKISFSHNFTVARGKYPKIQILTIDDLFNGKQPNIPLVDSASFRKAPKESEGEQNSLTF